jgi:hypothetical protein
MEFASRVGSTMPQQRPHFPFPDGAEKSMKPPTLFDHPLVDFLNYEDEVGAWIWKRSRTARLGGRSATTNIIYEVLSSFKTFALFGTDTVSDFI